MADTTSILYKAGEEVGTRLTALEDQLSTTEISQLVLFLTYWEIDSNGNLLPKTNNSVDIGKAEQKIRDIYEHT